VVEFGHRARSRVDTTFSYKIPSLRWGSQSDKPSFARPEKGSECFDCNFSGDEGLAVQHIAYGIACIKDRVNAVES